MYVGWLVEERKSLPGVPFQTIVYKSYRSTWDELAELEVELTFCIHTCQCCVIEFHTPILPVWLVATSWLPIKNNASTGTLRLNVPVNKQFQSSIKREARGAWRVVQRVIEYILFSCFLSGLYEFQTLSHILQVSSVDGWSSTTVWR